MRNMTHDVAFSPLTPHNGLMNEDTTPTTTTAADHGWHHLEPADYKAVGIYYDGSSPYLEEVYAPDHQELERIIGHDWYDRLVHHDKGWGCAHCGSTFAHGSVFLHIPTGEFISFGNVCASKRLSQASNLAMRKDVLARRAATAKANAEAAAEMAEALEAQLQEEEGLREALQTDHYIVQDILRRQRPLSEAQVALVFKLAKEAAEKVDAEPEPEAVDIPAEWLEGRITFTGTVVSRKWKDSDFGGAFKLLILADVAEGQVCKLWGTEPSAIEAEKGDRVQMTARLERSNDDAGFGFYKRPTKPEVLG